MEESKEEKELFETFRRLMVEAFDFDEALLDNKITRDDVVRFKELAITSEHIPKAVILKQILPILVAVNNDRDKAFRLLENYFKFKRETPEFFANRDVNSDEIQFAFENQHFVVLPPTPKNCNLVFHKLANSEPKNYNFDAAEKVFLMTVGKFKSLYIFNKRC